MVREIFKNKFLDILYKFVQGGRGFIISDEEEVTGIISYKVNFFGHR